MTLLVNLKAWEALPASYKAAFEVACVEQNLQMPANYDAKNPKAFLRLVRGGAELKRFPPVVLAACYKAAFDTYDELAAKNERFQRKFPESWLPFLTQVQSLVPRG